MSLRDEKRRMRRDLHNEMKVPAFYYAAGNSNMPPLLIDVRVHSKMESAGQITGYTDGAEVRQIAPRIVFWPEDGFTPARTAVVAVLPGEAYRVTRLDPPDDKTITAECTRLSPSDAAAFAAPPEA